MWAYRQTTGELLHDDEHVAYGYSGSSDKGGYNNPDMQCIKDIGPIPRGRWTISGPPITTQSHGPYVLDLTPNEGTDTCGRSGFLIHGDSIWNPGHASEGCLILSRNIREMVWNSGDRELLVTV